MGRCRICKQQSECPHANYEAKHSNQSNINYKSEHRQLVSKWSVRCSPAAVLALFMEEVMSDFLKDSHACRHQLRHDHHAWFLAVVTH